MLLRPLMTYRPKFFDSQIILFKNIDQAMQPFLNKFIGLLIASVLMSCDSESNPLKLSLDGYQTIFWSFLVPPGWKAEDIYKGIDLSTMQDNDPRAALLLKDVQIKWNNAPVNAMLNGQKISISGYIVPLDGDYSQLKQFLLVPYFGACIHSPPPPSNQVIHIYALALNKPVEFNNMESPVTVSGMLEVVHSETAMGTAGYKMKADFLEPTELRERPQ